MENGESPWDAAVRETREEVGLKVEPRSLVGIYSKPQKNEVVFGFLCEIIGGEPILTEEADEIVYFPVDQLPGKLSPKQRVRILDAVQAQTKPVFRTQVGPSSIELLEQGKLTK